MEAGNLRYISYGQQVGYAIASVNYLEHLIKNGLHINWRTVIQNDVLTFGREPGFYDDLPNDLKQLLDSKDESKKFSHQILHTTPEHFPSLADDRAQNIGMTVWETDRLPDNWKNYFNRIDKIIVPCFWNVEIFKNAGLDKPIYHLPHISQFHGERNEMNFLNIPDSAFVFLNISVWEKRKNIDQLVKAYFKAFGHKDNVILILKTSKRDVSAPAYKIGNKKKYIKTRNRLRILKLQYGLRKARIILIPHNISAEQIKSLYTRANAYVSLSHAEGWGMGIYESAWYGKPIVATDYSGYLDFLNNNNSYLVDADIVDVVPNDWEKNNLKGHHWANPDLDSAISQMRKVYVDFEEAEKKGQILRSDIVKNYSAEQITNSFINIINA